MEITLIPEPEPGIPESEPGERLRILEGVLLVEPLTGWRRHELARP